MKKLPFTFLILGLVIFYSCDPTPHDDNGDELTAEDGTPKYKDHEIDSISIRLDESTKMLDQEINVAQDEIDSLLEGI